MNKSYFYLPLLLITLLTGYANHINSTVINDKTPLPKEHGVVAVQVINNTDRLAPLHSNWSSVYAIRIDNRDQIKQNAIEKARAKAEIKGKQFDESKVEYSLDMYECPKGNMFYPLYTVITTMVT